MNETLKPALASTNADGTETQKVVPIDSGNGITSKQPTTPGVAAGSLVNTTLDRMNNSLAHVCDFSLEIQKNNALKKFLVAQAKAIRDGIRAIMRALGLSDATGQYQWLFDKLRAVTRELKWIQKNVIQPILDFQKYVIEYIQKIQQIIAWILTLPARLLALLQDCLKKLYKLLANLFTAVAADLTEGGNGETGFSDVVKAAKETIGTALQTAKQATAVVSNAVAIQGAAMATVQQASAIPNLVAPLKKGI
jgi:hypothetical protein